jgi:dienelactone hydrolase
MPIWVFHGAKDTVIPADRSEEIVKELKPINGNVKFTLYPDADHDSWTQ